MLAQPLRVMDNMGCMVRPSRNYCSWAGDLHRLGCDPTTPYMQTVFDLMLAGF